MLNFEYAFKGKIFVKKPRLIFSKPVLESILQLIDS